jgi:hypothetical protein
VRMCQWQLPAWPAANGKCPTTATTTPIRLTMSVSDCSSSCELLACRCNCLKLSPAHKAQIHLVVDRPLHDALLLHLHLPRHGLLCEHCSAFFVVLHHVRRSK